MTEHKYVRTAEVGFIIWPTSDDLWHKHIHSKLRLLPLSAGFCCYRDGAMHCYGKSESLGMSAHPGDSRLLSQQLGMKS